MKKLAFKLAIIGALPLFAFTNTAKFSDAISYNSSNKRSTFADNEGSKMRSAPNSNKSMPMPAKVDAKQSQEDKDLLTQIQTEIKNSKFSNTSKVQVRVENKIVYLEGVADSKEMIDAIEESALNILGVKTVINNLKTNEMNKSNMPKASMPPKPMNQPKMMEQPKIGMNDKTEMKKTAETEPSVQQAKMDSQLKDQAQSELTNNWFSKNYPGINIQVSNGIVFLHGEIDTQKDKNEIQNRIKGLKGVKRVENNITVKEEAAKAKG